jgi:aspartyl-tRNA(Asn)/glutamyl-tRNA(Gln) amidotransferase subunit C
LNGVNKVTKHDKIRYNPSIKNMSSIDKQTIEHLAGLARIKLSEEEKEQLTSDVGRVLEYVDALKQVPTDGLPEVSQVTGLKNINRNDEAIECDPETRKRILEAMPATQDEYLKVKAIFE